MRLPTFKELPLQKDGPPFNAWGLWGPDDQLGRLNLIDEKAVKRGVESVKHGEVINLNVVPMSSTRSKLRTEIIAKGHCNDDILHFNTQSSTQWDGFRHYPYQNWPTKGQYRYYNGMTTKQATDPRSTFGGIQNFAMKPITSRAHLLDIPRYVSRKNLKQLSYLDDTTPISVAMLQGCADDQGVKFDQGDILLVKTGWTEAMFALPDIEKLDKRDCGIGVKRGDDVVRWHWEKGFAAVASDVRAYESFPHDRGGLSLHEVFLAGWGMPIGELFDFRALAEACEKHQQWTFLFTSMPLYVPGGIASPPNAQAIL